MKQNSKHLPEPHLPAHYIGLQLDNFTEWVKASTGMDIVPFLLINDHRAIVGYYLDYFQTIHKLCIWADNYNYAVMSIDENDINTIVAIKTHNSPFKLSRFTSSTDNPKDIITVYIEAICDTFTFINTPTPF